jgi:hypothetical protein
MLQRIQSGGTAGLEKREPYFFDRWVQQQWGRVGSRFLVEQLGGAATYIAQTGGYEAAQAGFASVYR